MQQTLDLILTFLQLLLRSAPVVMASGADYLLEEFPLDLHLVRAALAME